MGLSKTGIAKFKVVRRPAFTLVELLTVIGIIGLLISILLPTLARVRDEGVRVTCASHLNQLVIASAMYLNEHHEFPPAPLLPALAGAGPSGITAELLNNLASGMKWPVFDPMQTINDFPPIIICPFRHRLPLFEAADTVSYGTPIWITGYSYTARLAEGGTNLTGIPLRPAAGAERHSKRRGVIWCDTLASLQIGGVEQGFSFFHVRGVLHVNPSTGSVIDPAPLIGQHRGFDDGSVEYVPAGLIDLTPANRDATASYKLSLPGNALTIWYWF